MYGDVPYNETCVMSCSLITCESSLLSMRAWALLGLSPKRYHSLEPQFRTYTRAILVVKAYSILTRDTCMPKPLFSKALATANRIDRDWGCVHTR